MSSRHVAVQLLAPSQPLPCVSPTTWSLVVVLGGDGSLLHTSSLFPGQAPLLLPLARGRVNMLYPRWSQVQQEQELEAVAAPRSPTSWSAAASRETWQSCSGHLALIGTPVPVPLYFWPQVSLGVENIYLTGHSLVTHWDPGSSDNVSLLSSEMSSTNKSTAQICNI